MRKIDDLDGTGKVLFGEIPDPSGTVAHHDLLFRATPAAVPGFQLEALAKLLGCFNGAGIGSGGGIAEGEAFLIPISLLTDAGFTTEETCVKDAGVPVRVAGLRKNRDSLILLRFKK